MIPSELQTLAEVAISLMGFTGLVSVIQSRGGKALDGIEAGLVATLLVVSALAVFGAFIPAAISLVAQDPANMWAWSFRVLLAAHIAAWLIASPFLARAGWFLEKFPQPERTISRIGVTVGLISTFAEVAVVLGAFETNAAFIYFCVIIGLVGNGMLSFVLLMFGFNR